MNMVTSILCPRRGQLQMPLSSFRRGAIVAALTLVGVALWSGDRLRAQDESQWLAGSLLVATEKMGDPRFARSVIYMVSHDADGAMGVIVNHPLGEGPIAKLLDKLGIDNHGVDGEIVVRYGGPVREGLGFVLHSTDYVADDTLVVDDKIALTAQSEILREIGAGRGPSERMLIFGYAGWGPGQLEGEIASGDWVTVPADKALIFDDDDGSKWRRAIDERGIFI
jgi:putative transcriptional regulator